ncbi:MAG: hypothetical protein JNN30_05545 [Rhodanobacteraceae bacterium]|nr:hypothetical protein [Rhodanobacteraceae bacterium]
MFTAADVIHAYTRADAIRDGALIDVTEKAAQAGFRVPVCLTARVWAECVAWPETEPAIQDESGRLWDLVFVAAVAARKAARRDTHRVVFQLGVVPRGHRVPGLVRLVLHVGPGDRGEAVVTILAPDED